MALKTPKTCPKEREREGRRALLLARSMRLLRAVRLMLTSVNSVSGQSKCFDSDVRMVRAAADGMSEVAREEGILS